MDFPVLEPPQGLSEAEKEVWRRVVAADRASNGVILAESSDLLEGYCEAVVEAKRLSAAIAAGQIEKDGKPSLLLLARRRAREFAQAAAARLGIGNARYGTAMPPDVAGDPMAEFFDGWTRSEG
jgi:hypothetical protein